MAEVIDDGIKLTNEEGALLAAALSASLFMVIMNADMAEQMLRNVRHGLALFGNDGMNNLQKELSVCVTRMGGGVKHMSASDAMGKPESDKEFDPFEKD